MHDPQGQAASQRAPNLGFSGGRVACTLQRFRLLYDGGQQWCWSARDSMYSRTSLALHLNVKQFTLFQPRSSASVNRTCGLCGSCVECPADSNTESRAPRSKAVCGHPMPPCNSLRSHPGRWGRGRARCTKNFDDVRSQTSRSFTQALRKASDCDLRAR